MAAFYGEDIFQKDILRILSSFFTVFNMDDIKFHETN